MGVSPDAIVGAVLTLLGGAVAGIQKLILAPIKSDISDNSDELEVVGETADEAHSMAEDNDRRVTQNEEDIDELKDTLDEFGDTLKTIRRLGYEQAVRSDDIVRALNESDIDANIPDRDDNPYRGAEQEQQQ